MAGIGFRLQELVSKGSYLETATAYVFSAIISTGPWLAGVIALVVLSGTTSTYLSQADRSFLLATIITVFAASLLVTGGPQMVVTRYLADRLYLNERESFAPTCTGVLFLMIPFSLLIIPFLLFAPFGIVYRLLTATLFLTLTMIWLVSIPVCRTRIYTDRTDLLAVLCIGGRSVSGVGLPLWVNWQSGRVCSGAGAMSRVAAHERVLRVSLNAKL